MRTHPRGSALLVTMITLAVLLVLVAGAIQFTGRNLEAASAKNSGDELAACQEVARQYVLSRLQLYGVQLTQLPPLDRRLPDAPTTSDQTRVMNAHYGDTLAKTTIVTVRSSAFSEASSSVREMVNTVAQSGTFGQYYKVVAKCVGPSGRETETEFLFRYGL